MNVSDTEIAWSVLKNAGYQKTEHVKEVHEPHWCGGLGRRREGIRGRGQGEGRRLGDMYVYR